MGVAVRGGVRGLVLGWVMADSGVGLEGWLGVGALIVAIAVVVALMLGGRGSVGTVVVAPPAPAATLDVLQLNDCELRVRRASGEFHVYPLACSSVLVCEEETPTVETCTTSLVPSGQVEPEATVVDGTPVR